MFELLAIDLESATPHALFWVWGGATLVLATGLGFLAGAFYANRSADRTFRKALKALTSLYALALDAFDKAQHLSGLLETFPGASLTADEVDRLETKRAALQETVGRIVVSQREAIARQIEAKPKLKVKPPTVRLEWQRTSLDPATSLPDRAMFDANLQSLLKAGAEANVTSGLLLVKIDRMEQLKSRFGILSADVFSKAMGVVISRAVREQDLACRLSADSFGILCPSVDAETGRKLAQAIRNSVRFHTFRLQDVGPEVLVTASFGYTSCSPGEAAETVLARAGDALAKSIRRGRNQLHLFEGDSLVHCAAV